MSFISREFPIVNSWSPGLQLSPDDIDPPPRTMYKAGAEASNEPQENCCYCIPADLGVKVIGIMTILSVFWPVYSVLFMISIGNDFVTIFLGILCDLPRFYSAFIFILFLRNNTVKTRSLIPRACYIVIAA